MVWVIMPTKVENHVALAIPPLSALMIHGAGGGAWQWIHWQRIWSALGVHLCVPTLVTPLPPEKPAPLSDYVRQACSNIDTRWRDRPWLVVGASLGASIALEVGRYLRPHGMVLINPYVPTMQTDSGRTTWTVERLRWRMRASLGGNKASYAELW